MQACSCDLFNSHLPSVRVLLFLEPFLPGFGAISKRASVFQLWEAWCSLLAGSDNGPHMVVLHRLTKIWGLCGVSSASSSFTKVLFFLAFCLGFFALAWALPGPFVSPSRGPVPLCPLPHLCSLHLHYATNKYSRNAMNAGLSVGVNVPK